MSTSLLFLAPVLVTLALKVNSLVGIQQAPGSLALVAGTGALLAMFGNPIFGKMSDRTSSRFGMRRPWMVIGLAGGSLGILIVAIAPNITILLLGWCIAQLLFNALLAAVVAVLPDQGPNRSAWPDFRDPGRRYAHRVGQCHLPGQTVHGQPARHVSCPVRHRWMLHPALRRHAERSPLAREDKPAWSLREIWSTFYGSSAKSPRFA